MSTRRRRVVGIAACVGILALSGCSIQDPVTDSSGITESEVKSMTLKEQYQRAGGQYQELNERVAALQKEIYPGEWREGGTDSEVVPGQGFTLGNSLKGDNRENSYYFNVFRMYITEDDLSPTFAEVARSWKAKGWEVSDGKRHSGQPRITATTPDGFWFEAKGSPGALELTGMSAVYWGDQYALVMAIAERRDAENAAGAPWDTTDRDEQGYTYRLPGVFRPFPAWDAVAN
ncbi:hypothetical protein [Mycetocola sp. JXN-3]|uniref:hypothetical protein n=1 Tax=Mycetocola sp. JXN-3 TaxID=2116510 RepID=UPI00165D2C40|nr:hypothetical protein [Mycetocola sp. JXN-3]